MEFSLLKRFAVLVCCMGHACISVAQQPEADVVGKKLLSPRSFGFDFDPSFVTPVQDQVVTVRDSNGERICGRLYCRSENDFGIVLLPNGELKAFAISDMQLTDEPFKPLKHLELGREIRQGDLARFNLKKSNNYVFVYNTSEGFYEVTKQILESMHRGMIRKLERDGFQLRSPEVPFAVIMFANEKQFQAFRQMPPGVLAYYNIISNHVVLFEPGANSHASIDVARGQALSTIAHEGAHQILHNVGIQQRLSMWPMWLSEGLAEYYAPTSFGKNFRWKGAGEINDLRMFELEHYLQTRELFGLDGTTIRDSVGAAKLDSTGYATAWSIIHYLAETQPDKLNDFIQYMSQLGPFYGMASRDKFVPENLDHFKMFFEDDLKIAEAGLIKHLKQQSYQSPMAFRPHYVTTVIYNDGENLAKRGCIYYQRRLAEEWRQAFLGTLNASQLATADYATKGFVNRDAAANYLRQFLK